MPEELPVQRLAVVEKSLCELPNRYLGAEKGFDVTYRFNLNDLGHSWEVRCTSESARVCKGGTRRKPDSTLSLDSRVWLEIFNDGGSGVEAFMQRRLTITGNLDHAITLSGLFRTASGGEPHTRVRDIHVGRHRISTLTMGNGPDVLLLHGLGSSRASMLETAAALSRRYRVHAPDLPGFGASCKPATGAYNARWFAEIMIGLLDELGIDKAHLVGNSMGGRVALEMALQHPERIIGLGLLCPAVAWVHRGLHPIVRLLRPELSMLPHKFHRGLVAKQLWSVFHDRSRVDPALIDLITDEFRRVYQSAGARMALSASARNIYLDAPFGRNGFYPRLAELQVPALFIWGSHDRLVPAAFSHQVSKSLPNAEQVIIQACGHVPQVERAQETNELLLGFLARVEDAARKQRSSRRKQASVIRLSEARAA